MQKARNSSRQPNLVFIFLTLASRCQSSCQEFTDYLSSLSLSGDELLKEQPPSIRPISHPLPSSFSFLHVTSTRGGCVGAVRSH